MPMDLHRIGQEYCALYMQQPPPPGNPIWGMVTFNILDEVPDESEIVELFALSDQVGPQVQVG